MKQQPSLKSRALALLARREMSRLELKQKLQPYAENEEELESVLSTCSASNWQSDERFTEMLINSKSHKHGRIRLQQELAMKGVDTETIAAYLPDAETDFIHACAVLRKKFRQPAQSTQEKQKQMRFLLYRGFTADVAQRAMRDAWEEE